MIWGDEGMSMDELMEHLHGFALYARDLVWHRDMAGLLGLAALLLGGMWS